MKIPRIFSFKMYIEGEVSPDILFYFKVYTIYTNKSVHSRWTANRFLILLLRSLWNVYKLIFIFHNHIGKKPLLFFWKGFRMSSWLTNWSPKAARADNFSRILSDSLGNVLKPFLMLLSTYCTKSFDPVDLSLRTPSAFGNHAY